ncbi:hypothetical protein O9992_19065 [Vibrio lentus]|nr:hypothetical protein [Vibrio lentus]
MARWRLAMVIARRGIPTDENDGDLKQRAQVIVCMALVTVSLFIISGLYRIYTSGYLITNPSCDRWCFKPVLKHVVKSC